MRSAVVSLVAIVTLVLALFGSSPALGQWHSDANPLPSAEFFGDGWVVMRAESPTDHASGITAGAVYAGPKGARVTVVLVTHDGSAGAVRTAWESANETFDAVRSWFEFDASGEDALNSEPPPAGCGDARRGDGIDRLNGSNFPIGVTLCAADPGAVYLVIVSGEVFDVTGAAASDSVVQRLVAGRDLEAMIEATPQT